MVFDGFFADKEIFSNHLVALALRHQPQYLRFTPGQGIVVTSDKFDASLFNRGFCNSSCLIEIRHAAQLVNQLPGDLRMNEGMSFTDRTDSIDQRFRLHILQQVSIGPLAQCFKHIALIIMNR
ncbi:hypothetical protein D3C74_403310 [compost metagenome]